MIVQKGTAQETAHECDVKRFIRPVEHVVDGSAIQKYLYLKKCAKCNKEEAYDLKNDKPESLRRVNVRLQG